MLPINSDFLWNAIIFLVSGLYLPLAVYAWQRRQGQRKTTIILVFYLLSAFLIQLADGVQRVNQQEILFFKTNQHFDMFGALVLALMLFLVTRAFLRLQNGEDWIFLGLVWIAILIGLFNNLIALPEVLWTNGQFYLPKSQIPYGMSIIGWALFAFATALALLRAYRLAYQPLHRNRITYWVPVIALIFANDMFVITGTTAIGGLLRFSGTVLMTYAVVTHNLPDIRERFRQLMIYTTTALLLTAVYFAGIAAIRLIFEPGLWRDQILVGAFIALILAALFTPLLGRVEQVVNRFFGRDPYSPAEMLSKYSLSISNIVDMQQLANVAVGMLIEAMAIERGYLFIVDRHQNGEADGYSLRAIRMTDTEQVPPDGSLIDGSPVTHYLVQEKRPLLQYDLDMLPIFADISEEEKNWMTSLQVDVYVPIFSKREWIGMLALGSKLSGYRYSENDLVMLGTIANQTATALTNARLVDNLYRLNRQLRSAYLELDITKRNLERLDRTKSDFISIASHELRTPLTVLKGYAEMMLEEPSFAESDFHKQIIKGTHDGIQRLNDVVEKIFDLAQIDSRTLVLQLQSVDICFLVKSVCDQFDGAVTERNQTLDINIPSLPLINADPDSIKKVFQHLVTNAIKFTPDGGTIKVTGRTFRPVPQEMPQGGVEIVVSDSGVGVDPNLRELIFTKFYQDGDLLKHSTGKTKFKGGGTGLGLALSRGIIEAHGGKIWVDSPGYDEEKYPGSEFHVVLPLGKGVGD